MIASCDMAVDAGLSYRCPECGSLATDLTDAELRECEQQGHCDGDDCPGNACESCGGGGVCVRGEDEYPCPCVTEEYWRSL